MERKRKLTQTKLPFKKKQKTNHDERSQSDTVDQSGSSPTINSEVSQNESFDLSNLIEGTVRWGGAYQKRKPPLGSQKNPFTIVPTKKKDRKEGYYMKDGILWHTNNFIHGLPKTYIMGKI